MKRNIFFNEKAHKYTDSLGNAYTSVTTVIGQYHEQFDTNAQALQCFRRYNRKRGHRYYGMSVQQIKESWKTITKVACDKGNKKHDYLETFIKKANGYALVASQYVNDRLYTVDNILDDHEFGRVDLQYFIDNGLRERYPKIYSVIELHHNRGYRLYAEIGVYNAKYLVSGLIDLLCVKDDHFIILDWKTNRKDLKFTSGYYKRDSLGVDTPNWINTDKRMFEPINNLQDCGGTKYTLQLTLYAYLLELAGLKWKASYLCHIRDAKEGETDENIEWHNIQYLQADIKRMLDHFLHKNRMNINSQMSFMN